MTNVEQNIIQWQIDKWVDKLNIIQWDNGWQTVEHKTLFSEIRVDKLNITQRDKGWQIEHYSVR